MNAALPAGVASIDNVVAVDGVDCSAAGNDCTETTPVGPTISVSKSANPASGTTVGAGDAIAYTISVTVANAAITQPVTLTDTLGTGLTFGSVTNAGPFTCSGALSCDLPAGTAPGTYSLTYTATVAATASGTVGNSVTATNPPGGDPDPVCTSCTTQHPIAASQINVAKTSNPSSGSAVSPGQTISYTVTATVANSATAQVLTLSDTLGTGLTFGSVTSDSTFISGSKIAAVCR